ncbi:MAG: hypothetical protein EOO41_02590 [Methanobacteriota archaeon]|nr:MAG: hypothetical protein EOO41_02590 [Euryarchaeota archaeon]
MRASSAATAVTAAAGALGASPATVAAPTSGDTLCAAVSAPAARRASNASTVRNALASVQLASCSTLGSVTVFCVLPCVGGSWKAPAKMARAAPSPLCLLTTPTRPDLLRELAASAAAAAVTSACAEAMRRDTPSTLCRARGLASRRSTPADSASHCASVYASTGGVRSACVDTRAPGHARPFQKWASTCAWYDASALTSLPLLSACATK